VDAARRARLRTEVNMFKQLLDRWPLAQQILQGRDGTGLEARSVRTRALRPKNHCASAARSVCPYCAVGCGQLLHVRDGKLINVEGNPDSPISRGNLCPKGAASFQLTVSPERQTKALYRRPGATAWEPIDQKKAMDMIADRVKKTRDSTFKAVARPPGMDHDVTVNKTLAIASLGGATLDNEWNYAQAKLFRGLGGVFIENQARI